ncbi:MAG: protein phosphatase 2C domain-containing protein [Candidatus Dormibacter sp.]
MSRSPVTVVDLSGAAPDGIELAGATHIGPVREENEDTFAATPMGGGAGVGLVVADGMGGLPGGGEAAAAASDAAIASLAATHGENPGPEDAVNSGNVAVASLREKIGGQPGTTLTVAAVRDGCAVIGHAGDSRAYLVRDGVATVLTTDHSWVGDQVRSGALSPGSERRHPRRNIITMAAMGDAIQPQVVRTQLRTGDVLALCSDGFWEPLEDTHIATLLETPGPLTAVVERAAEAALDAGGTDNVTVLALRVAR